MSYEDDLPEAAKEQLKIIQYNRRKYEDHMKEQKQEYYSNVSRFIGFIESLADFQLNELSEFIDMASGSHGAAHEFNGLIMAERTMKRGLTPDGRTYEEALNLESDLDAHFETAPSEDTDKSRESTTIIAETSRADRYASAEASRKRLKNNLELNINGSVTHKPCGTRYASLDDAMETFEKRDGCPTCHQKEKWG